MAASTSSKPAVRSSSHLDIFLNSHVLNTSDARAAERRWVADRAAAAGPVGFDVDAASRVHADRQSTKQRAALQEATRIRRAETEWIAEANRIYAHITSLLLFLSTIRRPYLDLSGRSGPAYPAHGADDRDGFGNDAETSISGAGGNSLRGFQRWSKLGTLTDGQRDEIDFAMRSMIQGAMSRIRELEKGEEVRQRTTPALSVNPLSRLLRASLPGEDQFPGRSHPLYASTLTTHRASIVASLNSRLAGASSRLKDLQERRLAAAKRAQRVKAGASARVALGEENSKRENGSERESAAAVAGVSGSLGLPEVSAAQAQMYDSEASALVKTLEQDLSAIQAAERRLVEISDLQTQLISHLSEQTELTTRLGDEAFEHQSEVQRGNDQLRKAKESNRKATQWLAMFLVGSGLGLLFLHWMD
ncbi:STX18 [Ceraceosorus bombacis]|uniref:STX18 n=1 Tax=Ceraceosorus bombacis TaxID=401625 RepID=A0A0P1BJQ8_9BASI|nr:STX18 [Ceraceosorus bombacis]